MNFDELFRKTKENEESIRRKKFIAPVVKGGKVTTSIDGLVYEFRINDPEYEGWAVLKPVSPMEARIEGDPRRNNIRKYLSCFPLLDLILITGVDNSHSFLAYPAHREDYLKRFGVGREVYVHLVDDGEAFRWVKAAFDGANFWFVSHHRGRSRQVAAYLKESLNELVDPVDLKFPDLRPEEKTAYNIAIEDLLEKGKTDTERKLERALGFAGAKLVSYSETEDNYRVRWTADDREHISVIKRDDLSVLSAGICLSDRDDDFDLTSLVGVMKEASRNGQYVAMDYYDDY